MPATFAAPMRRLISDRPALPRLGVVLLVAALAASLGLACGSGSQPCHSGLCVRVLAGGAHSGYVDGPALKARFSSPRGLAVDTHGNIYVADTGNNRIRRIAADGTVSTVAGDGHAGDRDGPAATAEFSAPWRVAVDASGALYVTERDTGRVRKIAPDGTVSTLLSAGSTSFPTGIAVGADGKLYVGASSADSHGQITTIAPDGTVGQLPANTAFTNPLMIDSPDLAIGADGTLYAVGRTGTPSAHGSGFDITGYELVVLRQHGTPLNFPINLGLPPAFEGPGPEVLAIAVLPDDTLYLAVDCGLQVFHAPLHGSTLQADATIGRPEGCGTANGPANSARFETLLSAAADSAGTLYVADGPAFANLERDTGSRIRTLAPVH